MLPWIQLDTAKIPGGGELRLKSRGSEFSIMLGTNELMNSRLSGSEEALATLAFADVDGEKRGSASTLSSMFQQISMVFGVALAAAILNVSQVVRGTPALDLTDFRIAFIVVGAMCILASLQLLMLPREAGSEVSGHRRVQAA